MAVDLLRDLHAQSCGDIPRQPLVDLRQQEQHSLSDTRGGTLAQFKPQGINDMPLFDFRLTVEEHRGLGKVISKTWTTAADLRSVNPFRIRGKASLRHFHLSRVTVPEGVRVVRDFPPIDHLSHEPVSLI